MTKILKAEHLTENKIFYKNKWVLGLEAYTFLGQKVSHISDGSALHYLKT